MTVIRLGLLTVVHSINGVSSEFFHVPANIEAAIQTLSTYA